MRVYIAGPISKGDIFNNVRTAVLAGQELFRHGHAPFIPHLCALWAMITGNNEHSKWLHYDVKWIEVCDAMLRLPGESPGADTEEDCAEQLAVPIFYSVESFIEWADEQRAIRAEV